MKLKNYWLMKGQEKVMLKIINWAHKKRIKVESLTNQEIIMALKEEK